MFYSRSGKRFCASVAIFSGVSGVLFLGLSGTAQAGEISCPSDLLYRATIAAGAGATGGGAIRGPYGAAIGGAIGFFAGLVASGGCKEIIKGIPVELNGTPIPGSSSNETNDMRWCHIVSQPC